MGKVFTPGLMGGLMRVHGKTITCMAMELTHGVTEESMKENIIWTKNTGTEFTIGLMVVVMKATGLMESNMVKANTFFLLVLQKLASGRRANAYAGSSKLGIILQEQKMAPGHESLFCYIDNN